MNHLDLADQLSVQARRIQALVADVAEDQMRWKPSAEDWSMLEVVNHLYDEEREDFRVRLDILLHRPDDPFPPIDPQGWVVARAYNDRDPAESLANFLTERVRSLNWLRGLESPDWDRSAPAPWGGRLAAGDMAAAWAAHDLLHLRQLVELHWAWNERTVAPYDSGYAGDW